MYTSLLDKVLTKHQSGANLAFQGRYHVACPTSGTQE
jgi:hypothetical protein